MRVYLAGAMGGRMGSEVLEERYHATQLLEAADIEVYDPAANEDVYAGKIIDLRLDYITMKNYVAKDEFAIRNSHVLLVLTGDRSSEGTAWEMGFAHYEVGIPVVLVAPRRVAGELMGFSNIKADAIFATVEEAVDFIAANYQ